MADRPLILLCNDDGIHARGIHTLAEELSGFGTVFIVAPHMERSAYSHALTISNPLRIQQLDHRPYCENIFEVNGTPADCVKVALDKVLPRRPDLIVSGINRGANIGTDTLYSGTVGAAMEGVINGCPAIAISCHGSFAEKLNYEAASKVAGQLVRNRSVWSETPAKTVLNVTVPSGSFSELRGFKAAVPGKRIYDDSYWKKTDPRGKDYFWLGADSQKHEDIPGSDCNYLSGGYATLTRLKPSLLDWEAQQKLEHEVAKIFVD